MKTRICTLNMLFMMMTGLSLFAQNTAVPDWNEVLREIDTMSTFDTVDFSSEVTVVSQKPGEEVSTVVARYFRRDTDKMFTMVILKPEIQKGQGYFSAGDDLWFYDPESRKFAYSSLKESFQDSDAQNSDFSTVSLSDDYEVSDYDQAALGAATVWVATLVAKRETVPVAKRKLWIRMDNYLILKEEHYSVSDRLMRTLVYPKYQTVNGRFVPASILIVDNLRSGERTQLTFAGTSVTKLPDSVFNKEYLQRINR